MRNGRKYKVTTQICGTLLSAILLACSDNLEIADSVALPSKSQYSYIKINFTAPRNNDLTRSNSTNENGVNGSERGQDYENRISRAMAFLYSFYDENGNENTVNSKGNEVFVTPVIFGKDNTIYGEQFNSGGIDYIAVTEPKRVGIEKGMYKVLVVANPTDELIEAFPENNTYNLSEVRDYIVDSAWITEKKDGNYSYSSFLMTSENDDSTINLDNNPESSPAVITADVERMAARIDYKADGTYVIDAEDGGDETYGGATVKILGAAIVNNLSAGSYLLKRVSQKVESNDFVPKFGNSIYLGRETFDDGGLANNYVLDPWTEEKTTYATKVSMVVDGKKVEDEADLETIYGGNGGIYYPGVTVNDEQSSSYWNERMSTGTPITVDGESWNCLGYVMENTTFAPFSSKKYATGVVFQAQFTPAEGSIKSPYYHKTTLNEGETFFKWDDELFASAEDMMATAYPSTSNIAFSSSQFASEIKACGTWNDVIDFANNLIDNDPTGYKEYLLRLSENKFGVIEENDKASLYWKEYMKNVCGYSVSEDESIAVELDLQGAEYATTQEALSTLTKGIVKTFKDGKCYYTWWIRHRDDENDGTNGIMEYAVVRNNIYKLKITSIYSLGGEIPIEGLQCEVYVKPWTMLEEEKIDL